MWYRQYRLRENGSVREVPLKGGGHHIQDWTERHCFYFVFLCWFGLIVRQDLTMYVAQAGLKLLEIYLLLPPPHPHPRYWN